MFLYAPSVPLLNLYYRDLLELRSIRTLGALELELDCGPPARDLLERLRVHACEVQVLIVSGENMSRANSVNSAKNNMNAMGTVADAANIGQVALAV